MSTVTREVYDHLADEWEKAVQEYEEQTGREFPCGPGCADCCKASDPTSPFVSLPLSRAEAEVLLEVLDALPPETKELLVERWRIHYTDTCILLSDDGLCLAYEGRPLWCRIFGLYGMPSCGKIEIVSIERWNEAVREACEKLRGEGSQFVTLHQVVGRLA